MTPLVTGRLGRAARLVGAAVRTDASLPLGRLKGGAQKLGQTLALVADGMPPELRSHFGALFSAGEPRPWNEVEGALDTLPAHVRAALVVEHTPFAAASLGQVHRGRLDGLDVAVKLQYPGVNAALLADLDNLGAAAVPARLVSGAGDLLSALRSSLLAELDLRNEAANARRMAAALRRWPGVRVAVPLEATERALIAPFFEGPTLHAVLPPEGRGPQDPTALADDLVAALLGPVFAAGLVNADTHPGNTIVTPQGLGLVDFGAVTDVPDVAALDRTFDRLLSGRTSGALDGLGIHAGPLEPHLRVILGPFGPDNWDFANDTLLATLGEIKRKHPFALRSVPFEPGRLALIRAALGIHHALRRLGIRYALGASLARVRQACRLPEPT